MAATVKKPVDKPLEEVVAKASANLFELFVLARRDDLDRLYDRPGRNLLLETYSHFILTPDEKKKDPRKPFVNPSAPVRGLLAAVYTRFIEEQAGLTAASKAKLQLVTLKPEEIEYIRKASKGDAVVQAQLTTYQLSVARAVILAEEVETLVEWSLLNFFVAWLMRSNIPTNSTLGKATDSSNYFLAKTCGALRCEPGDTLSSTLTFVYESAIKLLANAVTPRIWAEHDTVRVDTLESVFVEQGVPDDLWQGLLAATPVPKKKAPAAKKPVDAVAPQVPV
jgi:hypothetical protein